MTTPDVPRLNHPPQGRDAPLWWGMVLLLAVEMTVFALLITSYFYLAMHNPAWPPMGISIPELLIPTINTVVLLASGLAVSAADRAVERGNRVVLKGGLAAGVLLGVVFVALKFYEFSHFAFDWSTHVYGSIVFTLLGFHTAHVLAATLKSLAITVMAFRGAYQPRRKLAVELNRLYWLFVVLIWIPIYFTVYLAPRWLQ